MEQRHSPVILTIDDEENIRDSFRLFLEDYDFQVVEACNGREGLEIFEREQPDLVLCDLRMPELDGLEVLATLKEQAPETPIIVVSGTGVIGDAIEAIRRGAWLELPAQADPGHVGSGPCDQPGAGTRPAD